jgi:cyanophycin synthetase
VSWKTTLPQIPGFNERLTAWLPALIEHHCGVGERGGFLQRLQEGTWCGHVLEHIVIELLNLSGMPTGFGQTRSTSTARRVPHGVPCTRRAGGPHGTGPGPPPDHGRHQRRAFDVPPPWHACAPRWTTATWAPARRHRHRRHRPGHSAHPPERRQPGAVGLWAAQRRIWTAETERTSAIAEGIASDKDLTKSLLKSCGVPIPEGQVVNSPEEAWEAAQDIGCPWSSSPRTATMAGA